MIATRLHLHGLADVPILARLLRPWLMPSDLDAVALRHENRLNRLEKQMTAMDSSIENAARIVGLARAEFASLREQLAAEQLDDQAQVDTAVAAARAADAERLDNLLGSLAEVLPAEVPEVPTPPAGEPAVDPVSGESSDDVIAPGESGEINV